jgi:flagellar hook protein FlgE
MTAGLFAAASGLRANQLGMNVVSNNISNLNSIAFKASKATFQTVFAQLIRGGAGPQSDLGGTNPQQLGSGTSLSDITVNFGQGAQLFTGRPTDLMIGGNGFFTLEQINESGQSDFRLTRAGNFEVDATGNLVAPNGNRVLGTRTLDGNDPSTVKPIRIPQTMTIWKEISGTTGDVVSVRIGDTSTAAPAPGAGNTVSQQNVRVSAYSIGTDGSVNVSFSSGDRLTVGTDGVTGTERELKMFTAEGYAFSTSGLGTGIDGALSNPDTVVYPEELQLRIAAVTNPKGLILENNGLYSIGANAGDVTMGAANRSARGVIQAGALESSNVDLGGEFVEMILFQRGLEASSKAIQAQNDTLRTILQIL